MARTKNSSSSNVASRKKLPSGFPAGKAKEKKRASKKSDWRLQKYTYAVYIFKVLRQVHPECGISTRAMSIMESMMVDMFDRIAAQAAQLAKMRKTSIVQSRDIQTAVKLIFPGELAKHAVSEGSKAVAKYFTSKTQ